MSEPAIEISRVSARQFKPYSEGARKKQFLSLKVRVSR